MIRLFKSKGIKRIEKLLSKAKNEEDDISIKALCGKIKIEGLTQKTFFNFFQKNIKERDIFKNNKYRKIFIENQFNIEKTNEVFLNDFFKELEMTIVKEKLLSSDNDDAILDFIQKSKKKSTDGIVKEIKTITKKENKIAEIDKQEELEFARELNLKDGEDDDEVSKEDKELIEKLSFREQERYEDFNEADFE